MGLTAAEKAELAQLEQEVGAPKASGLTPEEQAEMAQLEGELGVPTQAREPQFPGEGYVRGALKALPAAGGMLGGALGFASPIPGGLVGGGMAGAATGKTLQNIGERALGDEITRDELYAGPVREGLVEGALSGAGGLVRRGAGLIGKYAKQPVQNVLSRLASGPKPGAEEITAAAERLGTSPTRGMLSDDKFIQKLESSIMQTPSRAGQELADEAAGVNKSMKTAAEGVFDPFRTAENKNQLAMAAKKSMGSAIDTRLQPAIDVYNEVAQKSPLINVSQKSAKRIAQNIEKLPYAKILGTQESSFAKNINDNLARVENLEDLRNLRSYVGKLSGDNAVSSTMRHTAGEIYDKLSRLEQNSITLNVIETTKSGRISRALGKKMVADLRGANKVYAEASQDLKEIAKLSGMGKVSNYADFTRKLESMSDEQMLQKMFRPNNEKLLLKVQKSFPEAFESMKKAKMMELYSQSLTKGEISIPKLLNKAKNLSPSVKKMMFGDKSDQVIKDIETVYNSVPQRVGPSGTPEGIEYMGFDPFSPSSWFKELTAQTKAKLLKNPEAFARFKSKGPSLPKEKTVTDGLKRKALESTVPRGLLAPLQNND